MLKADVVGGHDVADVVPMRVEEILLVMREAPLGHDAAAAARRCRSCDCAVSGMKRSNTPAWMVK